MFELKATFYNMIQNIDIEIVNLFLNGLESI